MIRDGALPAVFAYQRAKIAPRPLKLAEHSRVHIAEPHLLGVFVEIKCAADIFLPPFYRLAVCNVIVLELVLPASHKAEQQRQKPEDYQHRVNGKEQK